MSAGLSQKQITSRIYNRLHSIAYQLEKAGVNTTYKKGTRYTRPLLVFSEDTTLENKHSVPRWTSVDGGFNIKYNASNMSNGETVIMASIYISLHGVYSEYGFAGKAGSFEQGLEVIKQNFGGDHGRNTGTESTQLHEQTSASAAAVR